MQTDALKPCPFCGGEPSLLSDVTHSTAWEIECPGIACPVRPSVWEEDKVSAIAAWNNRAALTAMLEGFAGDGVRQIDRDAAFNTGIRLTKREWIEVYEAFARHRLAAEERGARMALEAAAKKEPSQSETHAYQQAGYQDGWRAAINAMRLAIRQIDPAALGAE